MTAFDLLFLVAALAAAATPATAAVLALRHRRDRALGLVKRLGLAAVAYLAVALVVSWTSPQRIPKMGDEWCFDDWCLAVLDARAAGAPGAATYVLDIRLHSTARRISQRARGAWIGPMDLLVIGAGGCLFGKPTKIRIR